MHSPQCGGAKASLQASDTQAAIQKAKEALTEERYPESRYKFKVLEKDSDELKSLLDVKTDKDGKEIRDIIGNQTYICVQAVKNEKALGGVAAVFLSTKDLSVIHIYRGK